MGGVATGGIIRWATLVGHAGGRSWHLSGVVGAGTNGSVGVFRKPGGCISKGLAARGMRAVMPTTCNAVVLEAAPGLLGSSGAAALMFMGDRGGRDEGCCMEPSSMEGSRISALSGLFPNRWRSDGSGRCSAMSVGFRTGLPVLVPLCGGCVCDCGAAAA
jgi:hypothetical protein